MIYVFSTISSMCTPSIFFFPSKVTFKNNGKVLQIQRWLCLKTQSQSKQFLQECEENSSKFYFSATLPPLDVQYQNQSHLKSCVVGGSHHNDFLSMKSFQNAFQNSMTTETNYKHTDKHTYKIWLTLETSNTLASFIPKNFKWLRRIFYNYFNVFGNWKLMRDSTVHLFFLPKINESTILKSLTTIFTQKL